MALEKRGVPTVTLVTDAFEDLFRLEAKQRGAPNLAHVIIPHPRGGIQPEVVLARARAATPDLRDALLDGDA